jgi:hypothetical protein
MLCRQLLLKKYFRGEDYAPNFALGRAPLFPVSASRNRILRMPSLASFLEIRSAAGNYCACTINVAITVKLRFSGTLSPNVPTTKSRPASSGFKRASSVSCFPS